MNNVHTLMLIVGKTGSGKSSLINKLCEQMGFRQLISQTTRLRRNENDSDHIFVSIEDYLQAKDKKEIIAETEIAGHIYYATKKQLYESDFYTVDPRGQEMLLSSDLPNIKFVTVYISCPDKIREERAVQKRGDDRNIYRARNLSERSQFRQFIADENWDYSIKNVEFPKAFAILKRIATIEGLMLNHTKEDTPE